MEMKVARVLAFFLCAVLGPHASTRAQEAPAAAQEMRPTATAYMEFGPAKALYYRPTSGPAPRVAFLTIHRTADFLQHASCVELSKRGYAALCMNTRFEGSEYDVPYHRAVAMRTPLPEPVMARPSKRHTTYADWHLLPRERTL